MPSFEDDRKRCAKAAVRALTAGTSRAYIRHLRSATKFSSNSYSRHFIYTSYLCDAVAAKRFFNRLLRNHRGEPRKIVTDKLRSYGVAHRELIPETIHSTEQYENNRAEQSHEATRVRERGMRRFKSMRQAQRFLGAHAAVSNLFNLGRHLVRAEHYRNLRTTAFADWEKAVA